MLGPISRMLLLASIVVLSGMTSCKCSDTKKDHDAKVPVKLTRDYESTVSKLGKASLVDIAKLIPRDVSVAVIANSPRSLYSWIDKKPWWKQNF